MLTDFRNEPVLDFTDKTNHQAITTALTLAENKLGQGYPAIIGSEKIFAESKIISINSS